MVVQGYKKSAEFIVTQHPTEDTMEDFWRMVWDKNSPVIVVLSSFDDMVNTSMKSIVSSSFIVVLSSFDDIVNLSMKSIVTSSFIDEIL